MAFPTTIRVETKLTTSLGVHLPVRELEALSGTEEGAAGIVAVLFWCDDRAVDGQWLLADASRIRERAGDSVHLTKATLVRAAAERDGLGPVRDHVKDRWPAFLHAFQEEAMGDHASLVAELERCHREGGFPARLPADPVLDAEHRANVRALIEHHGESDAGRIVQDLLAYLLGSAGYRQVTNNPVGVPDFQVAGRVEDSGGQVGGEVVTVELTPDQALRFRQLCDSSGEEELARIFSVSLEKKRRR